MLLLLSFLGAVSFVLALGLTPLVRRLALRFGLVDTPDLRRKLHTRAVPRLGGVPVVLSYVGTLAVLPFVANAASLSTIWSIIPAALAVFLVGLADDLFGLRPWQKLAGQAFAATLAISAGIHISGIAGSALPAWIGSVATGLWLIGCANAVNLIDGLDGLASGIALFACLTILVAALLDGQPGLALATVPLAGALLGFLIFNFNPASIFLGDCGSLTLGFLLGCYGVLWSEKSATALGMTAPMVALAIPLADVTLAVLRRFLRQQPIFTADSAHIHHRLLARGFTPRRAALMLYAVSAAVGAVALLVSRSQGQWTGIVLCLFSLAVIFGVHQLRYTEFAAARRMLSAGAFRRRLNEQITLETFKQQLDKAANADDFWRLVRRSYAEFGFSHVEMMIGSSVYADGREVSAHSTVWNMRMPLNGTGYIELGRFTGAHPSPALSVLFADALGSALSARLDCAAARPAPPRVRTSTATS